MMDQKRNELIEALNIAIKNKTTFKMQYNGGSHPGTIREILPVGFSKNKVRDRCLATDEYKVFNLDKMELINNEIPQTEWLDIDIEERKNTIFHTVQDFIDHKKTELEELGFIVLNNDKNIHLHRLENGKTSKNSYCGIDFIEYQQGYLPDESMIRPKNEKPWEVHCMLKPKHSYREFEKAGRSFYERALNISKLLMMGLI